MAQDYERALKQVVQTAASAPDAQQAGFWRTYIRLERTYNALEVETLVWIFSLVDYIFCSFRSLAFARWFCQQFTPSSRRTRIQAKRRRNRPRVIKMAQIHWYLDTEFLIN
jgi:hypothetical protein